MAKVFYHFPTDSITEEKKNKLKPQTSRILALSEERFETISWISLEATVFMTSKDDYPRASLLQSVRLPLMRREEEEVEYMNLRQYILI